MGKKLNKIICKYGAQLCALALLVAPFASEFCTRKYYQPIEPKGLDKFVRNNK